MSQKVSSDGPLVRSEVAQVLRRMRALRKSGLPLQNLLDELSVLQSNFANALRYVNFMVTRPDTPTEPPRLSFQISKERLSKARPVLVTQPAGPGAYTTGAVPL